MNPFDHTFEAGGKTYTMRYNFGVRRAFEREHKKTVPALLSELATPETHTADNLLLAYRMLFSSCHSEMTEDDIAALIDTMGEDRAVSEMAAAVTEGTLSRP